MAARGRVYAEGNILMSFETTTDIADVNAPYGKELKFQNVGFEGGMQLIRMRLRNCAGVIFLERPLVRIAAPYPGRQWLWPIH